MSNVKLHQTDSSNSDSVGSLLSGCRAPSTFSISSAIKFGGLNNSNPSSNCCSTLNLTNKQANNVNLNGVNRQVSNNTGITSATCVIRDSQLLSNKSSAVASSDIDMEIVNSSNQQQQASTNNNLTRQRKTSLQHLGLGNNNSLKKRRITPLEQRQKPLQVGRRC